MNYFFCLFLGIYNADWLYLTIHHWNKETKACVLKDYCFALSHLNV